MCIFARECVFVITANNGDNGRSLSDRVSETLTLRHKPRPRTAIVPSFGFTGFFMPKVLKMNELITALVAQESKLTMNSLEISELTGKRHDNVITDIRAMLEELELNAPDFSGAQTYNNNNTRTVYSRLCFPSLRSCLVVACP